jgi:hypothetical protein
MEAHQIARRVVKQNGARVELDAGAQLLRQFTEQRGKIALRGDRMRHSQQRPVLLKQGFDSINWHITTYAFVKYPSK